MKAGLILLMHAQFCGYNIRDYDLMKEETSIEPIIERIGYFLKQTQY